MFDNNWDIFSLFLHKNICCGYSLGAPRRGAFNDYPQHIFYGEAEKIIAELSSNTPPEHFLKKNSGPSCSKPTMTLVNVSLKL